MFIQSTDLQPSYEMSAGQMYYELATPDGLAAAAVANFSGGGGGRQASLIFPFLQAPPLRFDEQLYVFVRNLPACTAQWPEELYAHVRIYVMTYAV